VVKEKKMSANDTASRRRPLNEILADPRSRRAATVACYDIRDSTRAKLMKSESEWVAQSVKVIDTIVSVAEEDCPTVAWSFLGDGMMLFYDGDDLATKAVQTAIRVQERLAELNRPANGALLGVIDVKMSVGISTGEPWWFETTPGHPNVIGTCADTAARLCGAATAQAIFIDGETASVMNPKKLVSLYGIATGRNPSQYTGDKQSAALKGIPDPVAYHEVLWEQQRFGVRSEMATPSQGAGATASAPPVVNLADRRAPEGRPEKVTGKVKCYNETKGFGFITAVSGEEFFFTRPLLVHPDVADDLRPGDGVAFVAVPANGEGKLRRAGAILLTDDYAVAKIEVAPTPERRYGFFEIVDREGHRWLLFVAANSCAGTVAKGDELEFKVVVGAKGPEATEIGRPAGGADAA
jgi:class 3 adenylate cyclase/cold shock CspA family protein